MGRYTGKTCRLLVMVALTASFFLVEIIVGYVTNSLALVGDAYHMLSDVIALIIGVASVRIAKWRSRKNTYGWARAEVLGALINAVFLIALCFTIFVEAIQRMFKDDHIHEPNLMLIVGGIGLAINIIGLVLFAGHSHGGHGHSHGGHGHSHGGHGHSHSGKDHGHSHDDGKSKKNDDNLAVSPYKATETLSEDSSHEGDSHLHDDSDGVVDDDIEIEEITRRKMKSSAQLNMRGVFLHVMGDALGSVIVIISALVIKYVEGDWKFKLDPALSMVLVIIILSTSIPLMKESALILLQTVPTHIQVQDLQKKLITKVEGVIAVHEFHIWQLAGNRIIASAHIHCLNLRDYMRIAEEVKLFFHNEGIHSTTIQPEFVEEEQHANCALSCIPDCHQMQCCPEKKLGKAPSIFKTCCYKRRRKRKRGDTLTEVMINSDENNALVNCSSAKTNALRNGEASFNEGCKCDDAHHCERGSNKDHSSAEQKPVVLNAVDLMTANKHEKSSGRDHPRSHSEPPPHMLPSGGNMNECDNNTMPKQKYRPQFKAPSLPQRPKSMYEFPELSVTEQQPRRINSMTEVTDTLDKSHKTAGMDIEALPETEQSSTNVQSTLNTNLQVNNDSTNFTSSEANLDRAIKQMKRDLRTIRGDAASRESFLNG